MNEIPIETVLSENIKSLRKRLGWSQEVLAEKTGVSAPYITQIESGKRTPSLDIIEKLAFSLGVEYKTLFETKNTLENMNSVNLPKYIFEAKLISAITDVIHKEFN